MVYGFNEDKSRAPVPSMADFEAALQADGNRDNTLTGHESRISGLEQTVSTLSKISGEGGVDVSIAEIVYPVGAIYISTSPADPGTMFGGTWARITGRFLLAATNDGASGGNGTAEVAPGGTGGQASVTLSADESGVAAHGHGFTQPKTPALSHSVTQPVFALPNHKHTMAHSHDVRTYDNNENLTAKTRYVRGTEKIVSGSAELAKNQAVAYSGNTGNPTSNPNCSRTTNVAVAAHAAADCTGGAVSNHAGAAASQAHNNMPPYLAVYVWERTA